MANKKRGRVSVPFKSKRINLVMDFNALCELEDHFGEDIAAIGERLSATASNGNPSLKDMRAILWASMLNARPDATLADAGEVAGKLGQKLGDTVSGLFEQSGLFDAPSSDGETSSGNATSSAG